MEIPLLAQLKVLLAQLKVLLAQGSCNLLL
jgi:hypothetical protein